MRVVGPGTVAVLLILQVGFLCGGIARPLCGSTDFRAFYATGKLVLLHRSDEIYKLGMQASAQNNWIGHNGQTLPFLYPAFAALMFVPFACLPFRCAFLVFGTINLAIVLLIGCWVANELDVSSQGDSWLAYVLSFGLVPTVMALLQGQISFLLLCVFVGALTLLRQEREGLAGIVLSLSMAKFQLGIPVLLLFCAWRRWALVRGMAVGTILLTLLSVLVAGAASTAQYVHMMARLTNATATDPAGAKAVYGMFPSDMPNIHGLVYVLIKGSSISAPLTVLLSGLLMIWAAKRDRGLPAALCVAILVSYHFQAYDLVLLIIPVSVSLGEILRQRSGAIPARGAEVHRAFRKRISLICVGCGLLAAPVGAAIVYSRMSWLFCVSIAAVLQGLVSS
jgi:hypothetical protein